MNDVIATTARWFFEANQQPETPAPDVRQTAFYIGMQLEELSEKLAALGLGGDQAYTAHLAAVFKRGDFDGLVQTALADPAVAKELLDADVDLIWVSIGAGRAQGADVDGAYAAVNTANYDKRFEDGAFHNDPATNKVLKPEGWTAADLTPFLHPAIAAGGWAPPPPKLEDDTEFDPGL